MDLFEQYWKSLPTDLFTSQSKGSKARARTEWEKLKVDESLYKQIMEHTKQKEAVARDQRRQDKFVSPWKHVERLLKYRYWEDDLPKVKTKHTRAPNMCSCGQPEAHGGYHLCWRCYDKRFGVSLCGHAQL